MRRNLTVCLIFWSGLGTVPAAFPADIVLEISVRPDAAYTPGDMWIDVAVTPAVKLVGPYHIRIIASVAGDVVHERTITLAQCSRTSCKLTFPEVRILTEVRCRVELFHGEEFLQACEKVGRLWPHRCLRAVTHNEAELWVFDPSGVLQNLLSEFGVAVTNAAFQTVRDFGTPRIVFVGEQVGPSNIQMILDRVRMTDRDTVVVLLRQGQFPEELRVSTAGDQDPCDRVAWERGGVLLRDLAARDLLGLLKDAEAVRVQQRPGRSIASCVTGKTQDTNSVCSYLCVVQEGNHRVLYCQFPSTDRRDPRQMVLLQNLIRFACERVHPGAPHKAADMERVKP